MNSIFEHIEQNAAKYNSDKDNLKECFMEVCNKCNDLIKLNNDSLKKYLDMSVECFKKHQEFMDELASVKPMLLNKNDDEYLKRIEKMLLEDSPIDPEI